jgi:ubiquinone/menaquinone biosynthesis C-methylase UbiE
VKRVPEPELMEGQEQAQAYAEADFSEPNELFIRCFRELQPDFAGPARVLDLGCGPADIVLRFARAYPQAECHALDGSAAMLELARQSLAREPELHARISLRREILPSASLTNAGYDVILSNSLLHHLSDPGILWQTLKQVGRPGAAVLIMDLRRPTSASQVEALVATYAADAPEVLRRDFRNSLYAAFTPQEVEGQLSENGLEKLRVDRVSDRHLTVRGFLE